MTSADPNYPDAPVLLLARIGNDASNAAAVLGRVNIRAEICGSMEDLCRRAGAQTGAFMVSEETLAPPPSMPGGLSRPAAPLVGYTARPVDDRRGDESKNL